jgi:hypothetical protein
VLRIAGQNREIAEDLRVNENCVSQIKRRTLSRLVLICSLPAYKGRIGGP